ncbi:unnamed protein product [Lepeophtheirus salmonis]|uniref:(salmon louse) hypothetical protein n=1 Tax=Lepeophtheirus salmonis TaxID=72036 RepID=A0A7R8CJ29_LEPSM|nr:unnamed protein product [Lepeophtheirus salmonis]CAF2806954.1 unnamed protein product [Lepeophtheirus salmonis]
MNLYKKSNRTTRKKISISISEESKRQQVNQLCQKLFVIQVFEVLIRFRKDKVAFHSDISKMFNRIFVKDDDRKYQGIVWRHRDEKVNTKTYEWTCLIFGNKLSPDLSQNSYVNDIGTSVKNDEVASKIMMGEDRILGCGSFKIEICYSSALSSGEACVVVPVLRHKWDVESSYIRLGVREWPSLIKVNKRTILSPIARIWDPLGIVVPVWI